MSAPLTPAGEAAVTELSERYRVSDGAVRSLLDAVIRGGGAMAQFSHPDLGGSGQWMRGGMTMVGDMFNPGLQATVSGICSELSSRLAGGALLVAGPDRRTGAESFGSRPVGQWWPDDLGRPSSSGGQNDSWYAYFPSTRRLAIRRGPAITLYDTGDHAISGVQQQQGGRGSLEFSSQRGTFTVDSLPVVEGIADADPSPAGPPVTQPAGSRPAATQAPPAEPTQAPPAEPTQAPPAEPAKPSSAEPLSAPANRPAASSPSEIGAAIETLAGLRDKGYLTDDEFTAKKTELLARL